jgi:hypothetical protein
VSLLKLAQNQKMKSTIAEKQVNWKLKSFGFSRDSKLILKTWWLSHSQKNWTLHRKYIDCKCYVIQSCLIYHHNLVIICTADGRIQPMIVPSRRLVGSTDQAESSGLYFRIAWKSTERPCFLQNHSLAFLQGLISLKNWLL